MSFRGNQNRNRNFGGNNYGSPMGANRLGNMNMSPWDTQNAGGNFGGGGNIRQGGGQGMNAQALNLANNLLNNLFRNQNPPSLLDLPRGGGGMGNRNQRGGPMVNRGGPGNRLNNRRVQGGFQNRGVVGAKSTQKQGTGGGIRKPNSFDRAKKLLAKNATNKKKDSASGEKKTESKESPYASVPNDMFYCHLCKKHMWDANSFENHIKGRTHLMMREGIEESYRLKANMIRQEAKIAEQLKSIELDRLKRMGKTKQRMLEYCTMCDLNFHGHISAHRKSDGHLQLKKFLHPKCVECNKEFATRIDYDSHLLSADHLKKAAEKNTKVGERKRNTLTIHTEEEELKDVRPPQKKRKRPAPPTSPAKKADGGEGGENKETEEGDENATEEFAGNEQGEENKEGEENSEAIEEEEVALPVDPDDCIIDYADGDEIPTEVDNRLPKYNWTRPVGAGLITKLECYECSLCGKFFDTEKTVEVHSRTVTHHRNFLKLINEKSSDTKIAQKRAAAALEENERKKRKLEEAEAAASAEGGEADGEAEAEGDGENGEGDEEDGDDGEAREGDLYDPSEATGDDEGDADMENGMEDENNDDADQEHDEEMEVEPEPVPVAAPAAAPAPAPAPTPAPVAVKEEVKTPSKNSTQQQQQQQQQQTPNANANANSNANANANANNTNANANANANANPNGNGTATPTAANNENNTPMKKLSPGRGGGAKGTPRSRGRGRYNRY